MKKKGFAIIGIGAVGRIHTQAVKASDFAELIGIYHPLKEEREAYAVEHGCLAYNSLYAIAQDDSVDFVCICTPSGAHLEPALFMAEHKKNLIIEKPLEVTPERCDMIIQAAAKHDVMLSCVFQTRFHPSMIKLKKALEDGRFGTISLASAYVKWFRDQEYYDISDWRGTWKLDGGGAVMNQSIHVVDLLLWLMGPVEAVRSFGGTISHKNIEVEDTLTGLMKYKNGAFGTIESTTGAWPGSFKKIEICGDKGHAIVEEDHITCWEFQDGIGLDELDGDVTVSKGGVNNPVDIGYIAHMKQIDDCINAVINNIPPSVTGRDGKEAVDLVLRLYREAGIR